MTKKAITRAGKNAGPCVSERERKMQKQSSTIEKFSCCSMWQDCQKAGRCAQPGNSVVSREEYLKNCSMARRYQEETREKQVPIIAEKPGQLSFLF